MRRAGNGDDPLSRARARLVYGDAGARVAADFADPGSALADNRTSQLEQKKTAKVEKISPRCRWKNSKRNATATHVFRNGNLGSLSMAAIVFTENPFVMVHSGKWARGGREEKERVTSCERRTD